MTDGFGLSKQQLLHNAARVAVARAQMTKRAQDWDAARIANHLLEIQSDLDSGHSELFEKWQSGKPFRAADFDPEKQTK